MGWRWIERCGSPLLNFDGFGDDLKYFIGRGLQIVLVSEVRAETRTVFGIS